MHLLYLFVIYKACMGLKYKKDKKIEICVFHHSTSSQNSTGSTQFINQQVDKFDHYILDANFSENFKSISINYNYNLSSHFAYFLLFLFNLNPLFFQHYLVISTSTNMQLQLHLLLCRLSAGDLQ